MIEAVSGTTGRRFSLLDVARMVMLEKWDGMGWDGGVLDKFTISSMPPTVAIQCFCALSVPLSLIREH
jgi:hypothetical protein